MRLIMLVAYRGRGSEVRYALDMGAELRDHGWSVTAYTRDVKAIDSQFAQAGIPVRHAPLQGLTDYRTIRHLASHLSEEQSGSVILTQSFRDAFIAYSAMLLARRGDIRLVLVNHRATAPRTTWIARKVYRNIDCLVFSSKFAARVWRMAWKPGHLPIPEERIHVVPNSLRATDSPVPEPASGPKIGLFAGFIGPGCGLETVIDVLSRLRGKRTRLLVAGVGLPDYVDTLRRRAILAGVMDMITWRIGSDATDDVIAQCHFGVFPYGTPDAFGYANLRLMAAGRPQILTATRIAAEYLGHGGGAIYVPEGDSEALASAMLTIITDDDLRIRGGQRARERFATRLSWDDFSRRTTALFLSSSDMITQ